MFSVEVLSLEGARQVTSERQGTLDEGSRVGQGTEMNRDRTCSRHVYSLHVYLLKGCGWLRSKSGKAGGTPPPVI